MFTIDINKKDPPSDYIAMYVLISTDLKIISKGAFKNSIHVYLLYANT